MWTPKRIVILSACFVAFFMVYLGYAYTSVGRIDGLPPLPEVYWPDQDRVELPAQIHRSDKLTQKLKLAFGANAKELKWAIRLDISSRGMVLAAEQFEVRDGRVCLTPLSVAIVGKEKNDGQPPEIHTIRGDIAYLKFDRPVTNFSEITSRKIHEAELSGRIEVASNRRRLQRDEDLRVTIPTGTLYYQEPTHRIWTEAYVTLEDFKSKPKPHKITGKGMEMELLAEAPPPRPGQRKPSRETINGVKWISLQSTVKMDIYIDGSTSLMGTKPDASPPAATKDDPAKPAQKAHLRIETPGHFRYDLNKDHDLAQFDVKPTGPASRKRSNDPRQPEHVTVIRTNLLTNLTDHLVCQHLTLKVKRQDSKATPPAGGAPAPKKNKEAGPTEGLAIQTVHATAPVGKSVVLVSNADHLSARGLDFFHDTEKELTILKGGVEVEKEESKLNARVVQIQNVRPAPTTPLKPGQPAPKAHQHITAEGPGDILFIDRKENKTLRASWQKQLTSTRDGNQDLLTLTGQARFIDEQVEQSLRGDTLKVWLEEMPRKPATTPDERQGDSRRPRHLEATGNVVARSRDMNIHEASRLVVWFKDVAVPASQLPSARPRVTAPPVVPVPGGAAPATPFTPALPQPLPTGPEKAAQLTSSAKPAVPNAGPILGGPDNRSTNRPFDLAARSVEAWVLRGGERSTIDQLWCEGSVHIRQDPARAEEKGTEVKGDTLRMTHTGEGSYNLVVTGDLAELQTDKIYIIGPEVNIEQATNKAWVVGDGAMKMDSATNFQGDPLEKPVPLTVHWSKSMLFNGESAEFYGNIQAVQVKARLACQRLQVYFDRPISLKHGNKTSEPAKVRNLVCSRDVRIEDSTQEGDRIVKYQRLEGPGVQMIALEPEEGAPRQPKSKASAGNVVYASGPGNIRIWEPGSGEDPLNASVTTPGQTTSAKPVSGSRQEMRMTYVMFQKRMDANSKSNTAYFWENVRVLHMPVARHDAAIDLDLILATELPDKSLYIRCDRLKVLDSIEGGKPNKQMECNGKVYLQGRDFYARADSVAYNQLKQQIILDGKESGNATLYKQNRPGEKPSVVEGKRIIYNRTTGKIDVIGASSVSGESVPRK
ncbi:MAG: LptA/OstA family protein [Gemmataceae bacterium]